MTRRLILLALTLSLLLAGCDNLGGQPPVSAAGNLTVAFLDVGQGDATLIQSPNGQIMLIDGGRSIDLASQVIIPQLMEWGAQQIDVMVVTHPDADHIAGLVGVLEQFPVKSVALTGQVHPTQIYERLLIGVRDKGINPIRTRTGATIPFDSAVRLEVLSPDDQFVDSDDTNDASIVIKLTYGQTSFLLTGDAEFPANQAMLRRGADVRANVLKLGHHGSSTSTDENWLRAVQPQLGIISAGAGNAFGHPHREVIDALDRLGVQYIRTDEHGTITVISDGAQLRVTSAR